MNDDISSNKPPQYPKHAAHAQAMRPEQQRPQYAHVADVINTQPAPENNTRAPGVNIPSNAYQNELLDLEAKLAKKKLKNVLIVLTVTLVLIAGAVVALVAFSQGSLVLQPGLEASESETPAVLPESIADTGNTLVAQGNVSTDTEAYKDLERALDAFPVKIGLVAYSLDGSKCLSYNSTAGFFSACTIKIPFIYYVAQQIESGNGSLSDVMAYTSRYYHKGSGVIKDRGEGTEYTYAQLIEYLLSISDNSAYEMLRAKYGYDGPDALMKELGCDSLVTDGGLWGHNVQARDFVRIWVKLNEIFEDGSEVGQVIKQACTNTDFNYGTETLTQYDYSHKSGDNWDPNPAYNDAGILWCENPYVYAVFTNQDADGYYASRVNDIMELVYQILN